MTVKPDELLRKEYKNNVHCTLNAGTTKTTLTLNDRNPFPSKTFLSTAPNLVII